MLGVDVGAGSQRPGLALAPRWPHSPACPRPHLGQLQEGAHCAVQGACWLHLGREIEDLQPVSRGSQARPEGRPLTEPRALFPILLVHP